MVSTNYWGTGEWHLPSIFSSQYVTPGHQYHSYKDLTGGVHSGCHMLDRNGSVPEHPISPSRLESSSYSSLLCYFIHGPQILGHQSCSFLFLTNVYAIISEISHIIYKIETAAFTDGILVELGHGGTDLSVFRSLMCKY